MSGSDQIFLLLGSNDGDRLGHLNAAIEQLYRMGVVIQKSKPYQTKAWGDSTQPDHYNQAVQMKSELPPETVMSLLLEIEERMGRKRSPYFIPRTIDLDLLFYGDQIHQSPALTLPHPRISERNFVLVPMMEIAPQFQHPQLMKTIEELYLECPDHLEVLMIENNG